MTAQCPRGLAPPTPTPPTLAAYADGPECFCVSYRHDPDNIGDAVEFASAVVATKRATCALEGIRSLYPRVLVLAAQVHLLAVVQVQPPARGSLASDAGEGSSLALRVLMESGHNRIEGGAVWGGGHGKANLSCRDRETTGWACIGHAARSDLQKHYLNCIELGARYWD
jgi:hypothetical protein